MSATLRALVACGWFGIQTWIGGLALNTLLTAAWSAWAGLPGNIWIAFAIFWLVQVGIIIHGLEGIKKLENWSAPLLLGGGVLLLAWAIHAGGGQGAGGPPYSAELTRTSSQCAETEGSKSAAFLRGSAAKARRINPCARLHSFRRRSCSPSSHRPSRRTNGTSLRARKTASA